MKKIKLLVSIVLLSLTFAASASKLVSASILDKDYIMLYFRDGDVIFDEGCTTKFLSCHLFVVSD